VVELLFAYDGNFFLGDDDVDVEVARRLVERPLPAGTQVVDFGIRGIDLTYALQDGGDTTGFALIGGVTWPTSPFRLAIVAPGPRWRSARRSGCAGWCRGWDFALPFGVWPPTVV
jgi:hydrogenase maturation protease